MLLQAPNSGPQSVVIFRRVGQPHLRRAQVGQRSDGWHVQYDTCHLLPGEQGIARYHSTVQHPVGKQFMHSGGLICLVLHSHLPQYHT